MTFPDFREATNLSSRIQFFTVKEFFMSRILFVEFLSNLPRVSTTKNRQKSSQCLADNEITFISAPLFPSTLGTCFFVSNGNSFSLQQRRRKKLHVKHVFTSSYKKAINQILSENVFPSKHKNEEIFRIFLKSFLLLRSENLRCFSFYDFCASRDCVEGEMCNLS